MKKIGLIGSLGPKNGKGLSGQAVKTKNILYGLEANYNARDIQVHSTYNKGGYIFIHVLILIKYMFTSKNIIIMPAYKGIRVFAPLMVFLNFFCHQKLHYIVIGGWLPEYLENKRLLFKSIKKFNFIYVETSLMKSKLEAMGLNNVILMPNCKDLTILNENQLIYTQDEPLKLCTLSRVIDKKGIEDAVLAVKYINEKYNRNVFVLDIYGPIADVYRERFNKLKTEFPNYVSYNGIVPFDKTVDVLKDYFALLFPTHYYTEGIPGTIIDAYAAGIPIIFAKWVNYKDVIEDNVVGKGYEFDNYKEFIKVLEEIVKNPDTFIQMKTKCLKKAHDFTTEKVVSDILLPRLD